MSSREWIFRIEDILKAITKIQHYTRRTTLAKFTKNELLIDAVVRNFEIIGEASKNIPLTIQRSYPELPWKEMKGMRDVLIHHYFGIDTKILWHTTQNNLPKLQKQLKAMIQNHKKTSRS